MIEVTRLNDTKLLINSDQIEFVEETPDTVISFLSGKKIIVKECRQDIQNLVILYKKEIYRDCLISLGQLPCMLNQKSVDDADFDMDGTVAKSES